MAEADLSSLQTRSKTEEEKMSKDQLVEVHSTVREMIKDETSELDMIKQQCTGDLQTIGELVREGERGREVGDCEWLE